MSSEVGFSFQSDVVNLGSLTHMLTGRVLKALSDGGVDTYAVASAFWLGAKVPVRSSLADMVHAHVSQKKSYQSALAKALSIGWGHTAPVVEMTRTRAGSNALLLIGALSTGVSSFEAAQCLSELLDVFGLGPEMLPSVDVLRTLVSYLSPFVFDMGFGKVFQHIRDLAKRDRHLADLFERAGSASVLGAAIKQLIYTSQNLESHYMVLELRGSWLPAFASHILGMSVELMYNDRLIWACGGENGQITFQLGTHSLDNSSVQRPLEGLTILEDMDSPQARS
ncbi:hypothetical protein Cob_v011970 [Colletotrichum orbiculare MAFF 240422]|uniref:Uncharacterized protein n=1 Tax=Colletotrichum orbiculare (strain 104-T / ATCC 96160 / CBS 514.97 / LARS 414 / MAFF 240422) TaxID=1213857 RepID=A0A484FB40_COLOR|nr:hypothetical protein Cob_v011970 [Colletotrichum orbiculare MAFF 240422]